MMIAVKNYSLMQINMTMLWLYKLKIHNVMQLT